MKLTSWAAEERYWLIRERLCKETNPCTRCGLTVYASDKFVCFKTGKFAHANKEECKRVEATLSVEVIDESHDVPSVRIPQQPRCAPPTPPVDPYPVIKSVTTRIPTQPRVALPAIKPSAKSITPNGVRKGAVCKANKESISARKKIASTFSDWVKTIKGKNG